jgi:hypothetical protein
VLEDREIATEARSPAIFPVQSPCSMYVWGVCPALQTLQALGPSKPPSCDALLEHLSNGKRRSRAREAPDKVGH